MGGQFGALEVGIAHNNAAGFDMMSREAASLIEIPWTAIDETF
jgi:hypothetical protein